MAHILLVDDDPVCLAALAQRLRFAFRERRLEVDVAGSAAPALILAHTHQYDALIVDLIMPGVTGFKFIEQLAHIQSKAPIIVMSGFDVERCEEEVRRLGLTAYLPKPIDFAQLRKGLTAVLPDRSRQVRIRIGQRLLRPATRGLVRTSRLDRPNKQTAKGSSIPSTKR
jgi:DNA-binding response OmpR family regulator